MQKKTVTVGVGVELPAGYLAAYGVGPLARQDGEAADMAAEQAGIEAAAVPGSLRRAAAAVQTMVAATDKQPARRPGPAPEQPPGTLPALPAAATSQAPQPARPSVGNAPSAEDGVVLEPTLHTDMTPDKTPGPLPASSDEFSGTTRGKDKDRWTSYNDPRCGRTYGWDVGGAHRVRHSGGDGSAAIYAVANVEGSYDNVQTYDRAVLTFGIMQWTAHAGSLQKFLGFLKNGAGPDGRAAFEQYFTANGIDVQGARGQHQLFYKGKKYQGAAEFDALIRSSKEEARRWVDWFHAAGQDPRVQKAEWDHAKNIFAAQQGTDLEAEVARALQLCPETFHATHRGHYGAARDWTSGSPKAAVVYFSMAINNPAYANAALLKAADAFLDGNGVDRTRWPEGWPDRFASILADKSRETLKTWGDQVKGGKVTRGRVSQTLRFWNQVHGKGPGAGGGDATLATTGRAPHKPQPPASRVASVASPAPGPAAPNVLAVESHGIEQAVAALRDDRVSRVLADLKALVELARQMRTPGAHKTQALQNEVRGEGRTDFLGRIEAVHAAVAGLSQAGLAAATLAPIQGRMFRMIQELSPYHSQGRNVDILEGKVHRVQKKGIVTRTCNITSLSMALEGLGKGAHSYGGSREALLAVAKEFSPELKGADLREAGGEGWEVMQGLRLPDFMELAAIAKCLRGATATPKGVMAAAASAWDKILEIGFLAELARQFGVQAEVKWLRVDLPASVRPGGGKKRPSAAGILGATSTAQRRKVDKLIDARNAAQAENDEHGAAHQKYEKLRAQLENALEGDAVEGALPIEAYRGAVAEQLGGELGGGAAIETHVAGHFVRLNGIEGDHVVIDDPAQAARAHKKVLWEEARAQGMFDKRIVLR